MRVASFLVCLLLCHCGAAAPVPTQNVASTGPAVLDARTPADAFSSAARAAMAASDDAACWLVTVGSAVAPPESGTRMLVETSQGRIEAFVECGADPFPEVLIGRARFLIATVQAPTGYVVASLFGPYGDSYAPGFAFGQEPVEAVFSARQPDSVTLLELIPRGYETTDNELFQVISEGVGVEGAAPELRLAMEALFAHPAIGACADGSGGVLSAELGVRSDGTVGAASFWASTLSGEAMDACVVAALRSAQLPPTGHPWLFTLVLEPEVFRAAEAR